MRTKNRCSIYADYIVSLVLYIIFTPSRSDVNISLYIKHVMKYMKALVNKRVYTVICDSAFLLFRS